MIVGISEETWILFRFLFLRKNVVRSGRAHREARTLALEELLLWNRTYAGAAGFVVGFFKFTLYRFDCFFGD